MLDGQEHLPLHDKGDAVEDLPHPTDHVGAGAGLQAGGAICLRKQDELPELLPFAIALVAEDHGLAGQNARDDIGRRGELARAHLHQVIFLQVLPLGADDLILGHLAANQPFQPGVGVHAGLICADLQQPGVNLPRCGFDRDRVVDHPGGLGQEIIPGEPRFSLGGGGSPAVHPGGEQDDEEDEDERDSQDKQQGGYIEDPL